MSLRRSTRFYISVLMGNILVGCGTAGNDLSRGSKCIGGGDECHTEESPSPGPSSQPQYIPGPSGIPGAIGPAGPAGGRGSQGPAGNPGSSCSVHAISGGLLISCTDGTQAVILNGTNGAECIASTPAPKQDEKNDRE